MAAILKEEPHEPSETSIPPALAHAVRHCLEMDPGQRFHSMRDVAFVLKEAGAQPAGSAPQRLAEKPRGSRLAGGGMAVRIGLPAAALAVVAILAVLFSRHCPPGRPAPPASSPEQPAR